MEQIERVAYHEAGHAVACIWFGVAVDRVTIVAADGSLGHVAHDFAVDPGLDTDREAVEHQAIIALAGAAAEAHQTGRGREVDWHADDYRTDIEAAEDLLHATSSGHPEETAAYFDWIAERTKSFVSMPRFAAAVQALARVLIEQPTLTGEEAANLVHSARGY